MACWYLVTSCHIKDPMAWLRGPGHNGANACIRWTSMPFAQLRYKSDPLITMQFWTSCELHRHDGEHVCLTLTLARWWQSLAYCWHRQKVGANPCFIITYDIWLGIHLEEARWENERKRNAEVYIVLLANDRPVSLHFLNCLYHLWLLDNLR